MARCQLEFCFMGLYFGVLIAIERMWLLRRLEKWPRFISHVYLLLAVLMGWVLFYYPSLTDLAFPPSHVCLGEPTLDRRPVSHSVF